jgi:hypothetical protein
MADNTTAELRQRRSELAGSLSELSRKREQTYRLNSDALALGRAGVRQHTAEELARLGEGQTGAEAAIRDAQCEIRDLDAEIQRASAGRFGAKVGRALRRVGGRSQ